MADISQIKAPNNTTYNLKDANGRKEAYLEWGGKNFAASFGPLDAALVPELGANRLMFTKADSITIEYSRDSGSTWTDYGASAASKVALFAEGSNFYIGKADSTNKATANGAKYMLRVTIDTGIANIYTVLNKFVFYVSTGGSASTTVTIQKALQNSPTVYTDVVTDVGISGWSGYNVINTSGVTTYGNTPASQYGRIRFIFKANGGNTNYVGLSVSKIMGFGGVGWNTPSTMAKTGHLYSFNSSQEATFPAKVTATTFSGNYSGGTITGAVKWKDNTALPETTSLSYFLGIDAFANGGQTKWISAANAKASLNLTKADVGLGNVENKSSATIRGELTKANVTTALGYTPPTTDTNNKVSQTVTTTSNWRKVLLHHKDQAEGANVVDETEVAYAAKGVEVQPSTGTLKATLFKGSFEGDIRAVDGTFSGTVYSPKTIIAKKSYTGIYCSGAVDTTAHQQENGSFYFAIVKPKDYYTEWHVQYTVHADVPGQNSYEGFFKVDLYGDQNVIRTYHNFNSHLNTSYRTIYFHNVYRANSTGIGAGVGHGIGVGLRASANYANASYKRNFDIQILEQDNCTVTMLDSMVLYSGLPSYAAANYTGLTELDAYNNGLRESGDDNTITTLRVDNEYLVAGTNKIYPYTLVMQKPDGTWESTVLSNSTAQTGKTYNSSGFLLGKLLYYNGGSTVNAGANGATSANHEALNLVDVRYSFNGMHATAATSNMVANKPFYIVGTINQSTGLFYLDATKPWAQELPTEADGKVYMYMGRSWDGYRVSLHATHPVYKFVDGAIREFSVASEYAERAGVASSASTATTSTFSSYPKIVASNEIRFDVSTKPSSATDIHIGHKWSNGTGEKKINAYQFKDGNGGLAGIKASSYNGYTPYSTAGGTISGHVKVGNPTNQTQFPANGITVHDTRSVAETPAAISNGVNFFFSNNSMPDSSWWAGMFVRGWFNGYNAWELVGPAHSTDKSTAPLYVRTSNKDESWGSWRKIYDSSNKPTTSELGAVAKSGDTMSGHLTITEASTDAGLTVSNNSTHSGLFGIGGQSENLGIWDITKSKWIVYSDTSGNVTLNGNATTSTSTTYLKNQGGSTVSTSTSTWNNSQPKTALVWGQRWTQTGLTYTPTGGEATAITDTGDVSIFLTQSSTSNALYANLAVDGKVHASQGFVGNLTGTASALSGFKATSTTNLGIDATDVNQKIGYVTGLTRADWNYQQQDGALYSQTYSASWIHQIFADYRTGQISLRARSSGTWQAWRRVLDEGNFSGFALPLTGGTMSGGITMATDSSGFNSKGIIWANNVARIGASANDLGLYSKGSIYIRPNSETAVSTDGIVVTSDGLFPGNNNGTETFGGVSSRWANVYSKDGNFSGTVLMSPGDNWIQWQESGNWSATNHLMEGASFPYNRGGLYWTGQSDWIKIYAEEKASDQLNLVVQMGDDDNPEINIRNKDGATKITMKNDGTATFAGLITGTVTTAQSGIAGFTLKKQNTSTEGGEVLFEAAASTLSGIRVDTNSGSLRIFGQASSDGTTVTGTGTVLGINPYSKTITGGYTITGTASNATVGSLGRGAFYKVVANNGTSLTSNTNIEIYDDTDATTQRHTYLKLGNNIANGTSGNKRGRLRMYGSNTYFTDIVGAGSITANRNLYLPDNTGDGHIVGTSVTSAVGSAQQPVYIASSGIATACTENHNASARNDGTTAYWFLVAQRTLTSNYLDASATFWVTCNYGTYKNYGAILHIGARRNNGQTGVNSIVCRWLTPCNFNTNDFCVTVQEASGSDPYVQLWCKISNQYWVYRFVSIDEGERGDVSYTNRWSLYRVNQGSGSTYVFASLPSRTHTVYSSCVGGYVSTLSTTDLTAGTSNLATNQMYYVYE